SQDVPPEVLRQREVKWLDMLGHWDKWIMKRFNKVRLRCQKGIPPALRGRTWLYLSGGKVKKEQNQGKFQELDHQSGDPKWVDVIEKDLHRQFPFHEMFVSRGGHGQQDLFRVLKAYTLYRPEEGYCQAQAPIAAVLLMHMPAEDAFWVLVQICEKYLPGYYSPGLEAIQLDGEILFALLRRISPVAYRHLEKHKIDPILYMTEWFMCAFSRTLPWASVLRVWDMFLCDGNAFSHPPQMGAGVQSSSCPSARGENHLPRGLGAAEVHAGNAGEAEGLSGPVRNHGAAPSHPAPLHAGGLPRPRDPGDSGDGPGAGAGASFPAEALEKEPRGAELQIPAADARDPDHHAGRAAAAPGPAAEPHHPGGGASGRPAEEEQGGEEKQEEKHEEIQAHRGRSQSLLPALR
ncbi:unnamed protein product, partial [Tetraodon nigroviridis]